LERFGSKVVPVESGCHEWRSTLHRDGYGKFWFEGGQIPAHRMAYLLYRGEVPEGSWVLHTCDNRKCVNPDHLYLGDAKQNTKDRIERFPRWNHQSLSFDDVTKIRERYRHEDISQQALADEYGVCQTQISKIVLNQQRITK
jgi:hypothetical protein